jgi:hypothetical protein
MAIGAESMEALGLRYVIYVRPTRELVAQSWRWPASWHEAFEMAAGQLGRAVAICVLAGLPLTGQSLTAMARPVGRVRFSVRVRDNGVYVAVSQFTGPASPGPDAPGPGGGCQQPHAAHGLVLGLRGSGKSFRLVVFHGYMPPIPVGDGRCLGVPAKSSRGIPESGRHTSIGAYCGSETLLPTAALSGTEDREIAERRSKLAELPEIAASAYCFLRWPALVLTQKP